MALAGTLWVRIGASTEGLARGVARAQGLINSLSGGLRGAGRAMLRWSDQAFNMMENFTQVMVVAVAAIIGLAVFAASKTAEGQAEINKLKQAFNQLLAAIAPIGIVMLKMANEAMPPIIEGAQKLNAWFMGLSKNGQRLVVVFLLFLGAIGPLVMLIASFVLIFGSLIWAIGAIFSPIGMLIIVIVKLALTFLYLWKTNEEFRTNVIILWNEIKSAFMAAFGPMIEWFKTNWPQIKRTAIDTFMQMHAAVVPILIKVVQFIRQGISTLVAWFKKHWPQIKQTAIDVWNAVYNWVKPKVMALVNFLKSEFTKWQNWWNTHGEMILAAIKRVFKIIVSVIKVALDVIWTVFKTVWPQIKAITQTVFNIIASIITTVMEVIRNIITVVMAVIMGDWGTAVNALKNIWNAGWNFIKSLVSNLIKAIANIILGALRGMLSVVFSLLTKLAGNWKKIFGSIIEWLTGIDLADVGRNIVSGLARGISGAVGKVKSAVSKLANMIPNWAKKMLGIHSPSRVMMELGDYSGVGLAKGMLNAVNQVKRATGSLVSAAIPSNIDHNFRNPGNMPQVRRERQGPNITIMEMNVRNDQDIERIAHKLHELGLDESKILGGDIII